MSDYDRLRKLGVATSDLSQVGATPEGVTIRREFSSRQIVVRLPGVDGILSIRPDDPGFDPAKFSRVVDHLADLSRFLGQADEPDFLDELV